MERLLGWERMGIYGDNVRLLEMAETQRLKESIQQMLGAENQAAGTQPTEAPDAPMGMPSPLNPQSNASKGAPSSSSTTPTGPQG